MTILDGYTRRIKIESHTFVYRPATRGERDVFRHHMAFLTQDLAYLETAKWLGRHIIHGPLPLTLNHTVLEQLLLAVCGLIPDASGEKWGEVELAWQANLRDGVRLEGLNPKLARRSCDDCQKLWYSEKTGDPILVNSTGLPMLREGPTPCRVPEIGCLKGSPENQKSLNRANKWAYRHWQQCRAVGRFPEDEIVASNARIIEAALARKAVA